MDTLEVLIFTEYQHKDLKCNYMSEPIHVLIKLKEQETYFDGGAYPHYEIGWKKGDTFHIWNGLQCREEDIDEWEEI